MLMQGSVGEQRVDVRQCRSTPPKILVYLAMKFKLGTYESPTTTVQ